MNVSIVICTWNRASLLRQTLDGIRGLHAPGAVSWEVVVVNNASTDDTSDLLRTYQAPYRLRTIVEDTAGRLYALNRALAEVTSELLLFTDDDVLVDPDWLGSFVEAAHRHPAAAAFGGRIEPWFPVEPDPEVLAAFPVLQRGFCGLDRGPTDRLLPTEHITGANMGFRRAAIEGLRFRTDLGVKQGETIGGEELAFQDQVRGRGGSIIWVPSMQVRHYVSPTRMTVPYLLKFSEDEGRREVRLHGIPDGARFAGVPRWLVRTALEHQWAAMRHRVARRRSEELVALRLRNKFAGMARESRVAYLRTLQETGAHDAI